MFVFLPRHHNRGLGLSVCVCVCVAEMVWEFALHSVLTQFTQLECCALCLSPWHISRISQMCPTELSTPLNCVNWRAAIPPHSYSVQPPRTCVNAPVCVFVWCAWLWFCCDGLSLQFFTSPCCLCLVLLLSFVALQNYAQCQTWIHTIRALFSGGVMAALVLNWHFPALSFGNLPVLYQLASAQNGGWKYFCGVSLKNYPKC